MNNIATSRREMLSRCGMGLGSLALGELLADNAAQASGGVNPLLPKGAQFAGTAKRVIHLFMNGGPSHIDTFDPKPILKKYAGKTLPGGNLKTERPTGAAFLPPSDFANTAKAELKSANYFRTSLKTSTTLPSFDQCTPTSQIMNHHCCS